MLRNASGRSFPTRLIEPRVRLAATRLDVLRFSRADLTRINESVEETTNLLDFVILQSPQKSRENLAEEKVHMGEVFVEDCKNVWDVGRAFGARRITKIHYLARLFIAVT